MQPFALVDRPQSSQSLPLLLIEWVAGSKELEVRGRRSELMGSGYG